MFCLRRDYGFSTEDGIDTRRLRFYGLHNTIRYISSY